MSSGPGIPDSLFVGFPRSLQRSLHIPPDGSHFGYLPSLGITMNIEVSVPLFVVPITPDPHPTLQPPLLPSQCLSSLPVSPSGFACTFLHPLTLQLCCASDRTQACVTVRCVCVTAVIVTVQGALFEVRHMRFLRLASLPL